MKRSGPATSACVELFATVNSRRRTAVVVVLTVLALLVTVFRASGTIAYSTTGGGAARAGSLHYPYQHQPFVVARAAPAAAAVAAPGASRASVPSRKPVAPPRATMLPPDPRNDLPLAARFREWSNGRDMTETGAVPVADTGAIPNRLFATWKTKQLASDALMFWEHWRGNETQLEMVIVNDTECAALAELYPTLKPRYDALPLNVMRADICRVLAVYFFGGYYKDLDVDWRRPLRDWVTPTDGIVYGLEDVEHVCQWFFAARPGDPCVRNILQHITNIILNVNLIDFNKNVEAVIDITGPGAWTDALQGCPFPSKYSIEDMRTGNVFHAYAAAQWVDQEGYSSWLEDRKKTAGWNEVWPVFNLHQFYQTAADQYLLPWDDSAPPVTVKYANVSSVVWRLNEFYGPQHAFDGSLDTAVETTLQEQTSPPTFSFTFADPVTIGTRNETPALSHVTCVRVFNRHRDTGVAYFQHPVMLEVFNKHGARIWNSSKQGRHTGFHQWNFGGAVNEISEVRVQFLHPTPLTLSEIQLSSDIACRTARRVKVGAISPPVNEFGNTPAVIQLATTLTHVCPSSRALSPQLGFQYALCGTLPYEPAQQQQTTTAAVVAAEQADQPVPPRKKCRAFVIAAHRFKSTVDARFLESMHRLNCEVQVIATRPVAISEALPHSRFSRQHKVRWCLEPSPVSGSGRPPTTCDPVRQFRSYVGDSVVDLVYVDFVAEEWLADDSLLRLFDHVDVANLFIPLRLGPKNVDQGATESKLRQLGQRYALRAFHVNPGEGLFTAGNGMPYPKEVHLSFTRSSLLTSKPE